MDTILTRTSAAPELRTSQWNAGRPTWTLGGLLLAMAQNAAERLVLPQRDLSAEWFRFPLP